MVSHNPNMKLVVLALFQSIGPLLNVIVLVFFIFLIFGIMGITLMGGTFGYCASLSNYYGVNKSQVKILYLLNKFIKKCLSQGGTWSINNPNFDNILNAMIAVFILSTQEGWPNIMYVAMDGDISSKVVF